MRGAMPHEKNDLGETFLQTSSFIIADKLCRKIGMSEDRWIAEIWGNTELLNSWILLQDDELLQTIFKRLAKIDDISYVSLHEIAKEVWIRKNTIPLSYQARIFSC